MVKKRFVENLIVTDEPLATLQNCGGYYEALPGGPLVGYAKKYPGPNGKALQYVGRIYVNFAKVEQYPWVLDDLAMDLANSLPDDLNADLLLAAPMGGIMFAGALGFHLQVRTIFAEKVITALANQECGREESLLEIKRHEINPDDRVMIVEDVCNNFSTTEELIQVVEKWGAKVVGILCFLNRSGKEAYQRENSEEEIPVFAMEDRPMQQWRQDDPEVASDVASGNVVWKPKAEWPRLMAAMEQVSN